MMLGVGWALLEGQIGDNRPHSHVAHQVSLALDGGFSVGGVQAMHFKSGDLALIPAGLVHSVGPSGVFLRSLYVDPMFEGQRDLAEKSELECLPVFEAEAFAEVSSTEDVQQWVQRFLWKENVRQIDHRLHSALERLEAGTTPAELAQAVGVSTTRLREIAVRDFGVPATKLLQWLQIQRAIEAFVQTRNLADAAAAGGFSDQAHFTRRLVEWFGVTPSLGLAQIDITIMR